MRTQHCSWGVLKCRCHDHMSDWGWEMHSTVKLTISQLFLHGVPFQDQLLNCCVWSNSLHTSNTVEVLLCLYICFVLVFKHKLLLYVLLLGSFPLVLHTALTQQDQQRLHNNCNLISGSSSVSWWALCFSISFTLWGLYWVIQLGHIVFYTVWFRLGKCWFVMCGVHWKQTPSKCAHTKHWTMVCCWATIGLIFRSVCSEAEDFTHWLRLNGLSCHRCEFTRVH